MANINDLAWAAGLFEGEGWIGILHPDSKHRFIRRELAVTSTDLDVLVRFQAVMGCGKLTSQKVRAGHKAAWKWQAHHWKDIEQCGRAILPWLLSRRRAKMEELLAHPAAARRRSLPRGAMVQFAADRGISLRSAYRHFDYAEVGS